MPEKYYYHITNKDNLKSIFDYGLFPLVGENSMLVNEDTPVVCLCRRKDLATWLILLDDDPDDYDKKEKVILKIEKGHLPQLFDFNEYDGYSEYMYKNIIKPQYISLANKPSNREMQKAMHDLALSETYNLSHLCYSALRIEWLILHGKKRQQEQYMESAERIAESIRQQLHIMRNIDFRTCKNSELKREIRKHSNEACYVTFVDFYFNKDFNPEVPDAGKRCWEHLKNVQVRDLRFACSCLHDFIKKKIPWVVKKMPNVGGFSM